MWNFDEFVERVIDETVNEVKKVQSLIHPMIALLPPSVQPWTKKK